MLCLAAVPAQAKPARNLVFERLSEEQGLAQASVTGITQDKHGFIWLGTQGGLSRFDGYRVVNYRKQVDQPQSLADNWIQAVQSDASGQFWVGTRSGLQRFRPASDDFETIAIPANGQAGTDRLHINALRDDGQGGLWIGSDDGLYRLDLATRQFSSFRHQPGVADSLAHNRISTLTLDARGNLWVGHDAGVDMLPRGGKAFIHFQPPKAMAPYSLQTVKGLAVDGQQTLWVVSELGVQAWQLNDKDQAKALLYSSPRRNNDAFITPSVDRDGRLWLGTETEGLWLWLPEARRFQVFPHRSTEARSAPEHISALFHDRSGSLWLATWTSGAYRVDLASGGFGKFVQVAGDRRGLSDNRVYSMTSAGRGKLWLSTYDAVALLDPQTGQAQTFQFGNNEVESLNLPDLRIPLEDKVAQDWIRQYTNPKTSQVRMPSFGTGNLLSDVVRHVRSDRQGNLWFGSRAGLHTVHLKTGQKRSFLHNPADPHSLADNLVKMVVEDADDELWIATDQGLDRLDRRTGRFSHFKHEPSQPKSLANDRIQYLFLDSQQRLWVGTAQGLNRLIKGPQGEVSFEHITPGATLGKYPIGGILEDDKGRLWISTTAGITLFNPSTGQARDYTAFDGMIDGFYFALSAFKDSDGRMYFGGLNGLTSFHPDEISNNPFPPSVLITDIKINNESLAPGREVQGIKAETALADLKALTLKYQHSAMAIEFAAAHYADTQRNRYAYQLQGFDKGWIETTAQQRSAAYTNLSPGQYVFRVKAASKDGLWSEQDATLAFTVLPPYWHTWWFRLGVALALLAGVWGAISLRVRALTHQKLTLESEVMSRTGELLRQKDLVEASNTQLQAQTIELERQKSLIEQAHSNVSTLSAMGRQITASLDRDQILRQLHTHVQELMPLDGFAIGFVQGSPPQLVFDELRLDQTQQPSSSLPLDDPSRSELECLRTHSARLVVASANAPLSLFGATSGAAVMAPLLVSEQAMGVMLVYSRDPMAYQALHRDILVTLADYVSVALKNAQTYGQLLVTQERLVQQQRIAALGSLVAGVAHELNTPLGNSLTVASTLMEKSIAFAGRIAHQGALRKSELNDFVEEAKQSAALLMRGLIRSADLISSFKQVAGDSASEQRKRFNLNDLCCQVSRDMQDALNDGGHDLTLSVPPDVQMDSYPEPLAQVLSHLIGNAIVHGFEARRGGHIALTVRTKEVGGQVQIELKDDGHGIAPKDLERIFDPFFTTKLGQGGSGLGLSISYNLIHAILGGTIRVISEPGQGTRFILDLPLVAPQGSAPV